MPTTATADWTTYETIGGLKPAAGGLLFDVAWLPDASCLLVAVLAVLGVLLSLRLPNLLVTRKLGEAAYAK